MGYPGTIDPDERGMLHDLIHTFVCQLNTERRLNADLTRELEALKARLQVLEAVAYGIV